MNPKQPHSDPVQTDESRVTTERLVRDLAKAMDIYIGDARMCVKLLFDILRDHMINGRVVTVNKFGSFRGKRVESRIETVDGKTTVTRGVKAKFEPSKRCFYG